MQKKFFLTQKWMKVVNEPDDKTLSKLRDLLIRMYDLVSDIIAIDEVIEILKYVLKYNCRLPYTKHDLNLMWSVWNQILTWLVNISDKLDPITVYNNYIETLDHMKNMLRNNNEYSE